jgi:hypothetical protein
MKCAVEVDTGIMIYIPSYINIGSRIQMLNGRDSYTHRLTDSMVIA